MSPSSPPPGDLDASLRDFEPPDSPLLRHYSPATTATTSRAPPSEPATTTTDDESLPATEEESEADPDRDPLAEEEEEEEERADSDSASAGGFSPPAWRRLGNGGRSSGFWRDGPDAPTVGALPLRLDSPERWVPRFGDGDYGEDDGDEPLELDSDDDDNMVLQTAIRTRLPPGSASPDRRRSESPQRPDEDTTLRAGEVNPAAAKSDQDGSSSPPPDNYIRFAVRAEVLHRTEPIEDAVAFIRSHYERMTATWTSTLASLLAALLGLTALRLLLQRPEALPAGDLVKVAGLARSFEPLIYYSENAVAQVHDLQATSVAVWDLGESVRTSGMRDAASIVDDLDRLSATMKTLAVEMTSFFARVDGDIDGILNVMDWARMHLNRLNSAPPPSAVASAYDNLHNMLSSARIFTDDDGSPTALGAAAQSLFGLSGPQRQQRAVQHVFTEFLTVLEQSITEELQHSVALFALFEVVDAHFLNLARTVVREFSVQEELRADQLSGLWTRLLGPRADQLRKFELNRALLADVRDKTVRNKGVLVEHNGKLLSLRVALEGLRTRLVSPLLRGRNSSALTLEDQIAGIARVSDHLGAVRRDQRGKVMETLFAAVPGRKYMIDQAGAGGVIGEIN